MSSQEATRTRESGRAALNSGGANYIYAVVGAGNDKSFDFLGINDRPVRAVARDGIASVVSELDGDRIRPERRHLAAHRAVLSRLIEREEAVLPMRFGAIASGPSEIVRLLSRNRDTFARQLRRVAGKMEMGVRVVWDVPNIFEHFVKVHAELRELRDAIFNGAVKPSQQEKIELGRMFERLLDEQRLARTRVVEKVLGPRCAEILHNPPREEREVMNLACLVDKRRRREFEAGVFEAARLFDNNFAFDFNGPWAPHAFAEINLRG